MKKYFLLMLSAACCLILLCACNNREVKVAYLTEEGGIVYGNLIQSIKVGKDCAQVYAVSEAGYRFIGWSDGVKTNERLDTDVKGSKTITAQFEEIKVLFFSNDFLVRQYSLNEFITVDKWEVIGHSWTGDFVGWKFSGEYSGYSSDNPLSFICTYLAKFSDISDITLEAVYSKSPVSNDTAQQFKTIAHALGGINDKTYVNSMEAFEYWYN